MILTGGLVILGVGFEEILSLGDGSGVSAPGKCLGRRVGTAV